MTGNVEIQNESFEQLPSDLQTPLPIPKFFPKNG